MQEDTVKSQLESQLPLLHENNKERAKLIYERFHGLRLRLDSEIKLKALRTTRVVAALQAEQEQNSVTKLGSICSPEKIILLDKTIQINTCHKI